MFYASYIWFVIHNDGLSKGILYTQIEAAESWEDTIDDIVADFEKQHRRKLLYSISFYWTRHEYTNRTLPSPNLFNLQSFYFQWKISSISHET